MPNYYTDFSIQIEIDPAEVDWLKHTLLHTAPDEDYDEGCWEFAWQIQDDGTKLWCFVNDSGDVEHLATLYQRYLQVHHPDRVIWFEWANTCSKPCLDAFGGGACVVTATATYWFSTGQWASEISARTQWEQRELESDMLTDLFSALTYTGCEEEDWYDAEHLEIKITKTGFGSFRAQVQFKPLEGEGQPETG